MAVSMKTEYIDVPGGYLCLNVYGAEKNSTIPVLYIHGGPGGNIESCLLYTSMALFVKYFREGSPEL